MRFFGGYFVVSYDMSVNGKREHVNIEDPSINEVIEDDVVYCGKCRKFIEEPRFLDCLHYFCKKCIEIEVNTSQTGKISCFSCPKETCVPDKDADRLPPVGFLEPMKEMYVTASQAKKQRIDGLECQQCPVDVIPKGEARKYCYSCKLYICEVCNENHKRLRTLSAHEVDDLDQLKASRISKSISQDIVSWHCKKHRDELIQSFCSQCEEVICHDCSQGDHKDHPTRMLSVWRKEQFPTLQSQYDLLCAQDRRLKDGIARVNKVKEIVKSDNENKKKFIKDWYAKVRKVQKRNEEYGLQHLSDMDEWLQSVLDKQLKVFHTCLSERERISYLMKRCLESKSDIDIAACHRVMVQRASEIIQICEAQNTTPVIPECNEVIHMECKTFEELEPCLDEWFKENLKVVGPQADVSKTRLERNFQRAVYVDEEMTFTINAVYENGQPCVTKQEFYAEIETPSSSGSRKRIEVESSSKDTYHVRYTPEEKGTYKVFVYNSDNRN